MPAEIDTRKNVEAALADFHRNSGRYIVALRQPPLLFASIKLVLQLASARGQVEGESVPLEVARSAQFFVRAALLRPSASHYALLGLEPGADVVEVKERYRLMMRLLHPDFAGTAAWPADSASRVNLAYEVLSSPERRAAYDEELLASAAAAVPREAQGPGRTVRVAPVQDPRIWLRRLAVGFGVAGVAGVMVAWFAAGTGDRESLVQRTSPAVAVVGPRVTLLDAYVTPPKALAMPAIIEAPVSVNPSPTRDSLPAVAAAPSPAIQLALATGPAVANPRGGLSMLSPIVPAALSISSPAGLQLAQVQLAATPSVTPAAIPAPVGVQVAQAITPVTRGGPTPEAARQAIPTMKDVHQPLMQLLQQLESGWADELLSSLDRPVRNSPGAQALAEQFHELVEGARPIRIASADLRGQPRDDRLVVMGQVTFKVRNAGSPSRQLSFVAEYMLREGAPVLTRIARAE